MNNVFDLKKFNKLVKVMTYLINQDAKFVLIGINWTQVIRYHPEYIKSYLLLYKSQSYFIFNFSLRLFKFIFLIIKNLILSLFLFKRNLVTLKKTDIIIISHFINKDQVDLEKDLYFGGISDFFSEKKIKGIFFLHNHTSLSVKNIEDSWQINNFPRYASSSCLALRDEINIIFKGIKICWNFLLKFKNKNALIDRVQILTGVEAISPASLKAQRFTKELGDIIKATQPKVVFFTFEGHSWERLIIKKIKSINKNIICTGYVHTMVFPNQHASLVNYKKSFMPDNIFVSGEMTKAIFDKKLFNTIPVVVLGSDKIIQNKIKKKNEVETNILILPEGFVSETNLLFNFGIDLARNIQNLKVRIRLHPNMEGSKAKFMKLINKEGLLNIKVSNGSLNEDFLWSSHALYRGSTSIIEALSNGILPIYYSRKNEPIIDPLFMKKDRKYYVENVKDVVELFMRWGKKSHEEKIKYKQDNIIYSKEILEPLKPKVLELFYKQNLEIKK
ncbi:hypothetical protein N8Z28_01335 [bacterium]|nr:hypothetical protein [bacterium]